MRIHITVWTDEQTFFIRKRVVRHSDFIVTGDLLGTFGQLRRFFAFVISVL